MYVKIKSGITHPIQSGRRPTRSHGEDHVPEAYGVHIADNIYITEIACQKMPIRIVRPESLYSSGIGQYGGELADKGNRGI